MLPELIEPVELRPPVREPAAAKKVRILMVDECPLIMEGVASVLKREANLEVCGMATSRTQALQLAERFSPEMVITELTLGNFEGFDLIKDLRGRSARMKILVVSAVDENVHAARAVQAGANGYISQKAPVADIIAAIQRVSRGEVYLSQPIRNQLFTKFSKVSREKPTFPSELLTDRERQILELVGDGIGRTEIAERLGLHVNTVETYRGRIKLKLRLKDANDLLQYAIQAKRHEPIGR
jgi:DNA-binding NarL/FixJ family response regulator